MSTDASPAAPAAAVSKGRVLLHRLLSTVVLWSLLLGALFSGVPVLSHAVFVVVMSLLVVTGMAEFYGMVRARGLACFPGWGMVGGVLLVGGTFWHVMNPPSNLWPGEVNDFETGFLVLFVLGLGVRQLWARHNPHGLQAVGMTLLGLFYVPYLLNFIQKIHFFPGVNGTLFLVYFIVVTKFSDTGAYAVGSLLGRHKMIPRISPGKTWEGLAGAILVPVGVSVLFAHWAGDRLAGMTWLHALALGVILGGGAVVGDLIESCFKREAGLKDSGRYFPGIGGILDLIDSLLFNAPLMYLYLRLLLS